MTRVIHKTTLNETKKSKKARFSIINVIAGIFVITFIGLVIWGVINSYYEDKNYMDNFYEIYDPKEYRWIFYKLLHFLQMYSKIGML